MLDRGWNPTLGGRIPRADPKHASSYFYWDKSHPTDAGHQVLAELLASALLRAVAEEAAPPGAAEAAAGQAAWQRGSRLEGASKRQPALPPPMIPGSSDASTTLCAIQVVSEGEWASCICLAFASPACCLFTRCLFARRPSHLLLVASAACGQHKCRLSFVCRRNPTSLPPPAACRRTSRARWWPPRASPTAPSALRPRALWRRSGPGRGRSQVGPGSRF